MICSYCNHEQADGSAFCEKCGANLGQQQAPQQPYGQQSYDQQQQGFSPYQQPFSQPNYDVTAAQSKAQTSMILGIIGFFVCGTGLVLGIIAIVMGSNARGTLKRANVQQGQGSALAGIVLGIIEIILPILFIILYVTVIAASIASI